MHTESVRWIFSAILIIRMMHIASHRIRPMQQWNFFIWDRYIYFLLRAPPPHVVVTIHLLRMLTWEWVLMAVPQTSVLHAATGIFIIWRIRLTASHFLMTRGDKTMKPVYSKFQKTQKSVNKRDKKRKKIPSLKFSPLFFYL